MTLTLAFVYLRSIGIVSSTADIPIGGLRFALLEKIAKCAPVDGVEGLIGKTTTDKYRFLSLGNIIIDV